MDSEMTGHSARRSAAMNYAREGLSVHSRQFLGRRKSSAAFRYIEEAMTEIPMNLGVAREEPEQDKVPKERAKRRGIGAQSRSRLSAS